MRWGSASADKAARRESPFKSSVSIQGWILRAPWENHSNGENVPCPDKQLRRPHAQTFKREVRRVPSDESSGRMSLGGFHYRKAPQGGPHLRPC